LDRFSFAIWGCGRQAKLLGVGQVNKVVLKLNAMHFRQIHHFALSVPNLNESVKWYTETLGFSTERRFGFPELKTEIVHLISSSGIRIELLYTEGSASSPDIGRDAFGAIATQGAKHIGLQVENIDEVADELKCKGVYILQDVMTVEPAGVRNFWILDNAGNQIEINQPL
jgi:catechol 2,3-dioxygenase-like lactoylglutathione lyase family enzyme